MERCPTCGGLRSVRKYATAEDRRVGVKDAFRRRSERRAIEDLETLSGEIPSAFVASDVGRALRAVGRSWSEADAVVNRWVRFGVVHRIEDVVVVTRSIRRWAFARHVSIVDGALKRNEVDLSK